MSEIDNTDSINNTENGEHQNTYTVSMHVQLGNVGTVVSTTVTGSNQTEALNIATSIIRGCVRITPTSVVQVQ